MNKRNADRITCRRSFIVKNGGKPFEQAFYLYMNNCTSEHYLPILYFNLMLSAIIAINSELVGLPRLLCIV